MEKLVYLLWRDAAHPPAAWFDALRTQRAPALQAAGARQLRLNLADGDVAPAAAMRLAPEPPLPDALVSFWLDSASQRDAVEQCLQQDTARLAGYVVAESEPLRNTQYPAAPGTRTTGMNHVVFLRIPAHLTREQWLERWLVHHTPVAIETQENFGYRQNLVVRPLTAGAPAIDAIVEENFLPAAMVDQDAFYRRNSPAQLKENQKRMFASCSTFIDFAQLARLPTSEYNLAS